MVVLAGPHAGLVIWVGLRQACDVNVQAVGDVNPPGVNDVEPVASFSLDAGGVDVKEVSLAHGRIVVGGVVVLGEVPVLAQVGEGGAGDLGVNVPVPR